MFPGGSRKFCIIYDRLPGLDLYYPDSAQHLVTAAYDPDDLGHLDHDLSHV